jgi:hypothetical protein
MLINDPLSGYSPVVAFLLLGEWLFLALFLWEFRLGMKTLDALVTRVSLSFGIRMQLHLGFFEDAEVMSSPRAEVRADDLK